MTKRIESDKALRDKAFKMGCNPKYDGYERQLPSLVYYFFDEKSKSSGIKSMWNQQLANKLHKPIIRKLENWREEKYIHHLKKIYGELI